MPVVGFGEDHLDRTDRPWGVDDHQSLRDAPAEGHQHPCAGPRKAHLVDQQPGQQPLRPQWLVRGAVWGRGGAVPDRRLNPTAMHPMATLAGWMLQEPTQGWRW